MKANGADLHVHADFGSGLWDGGPIGIPVTVVDGSQPTFFVDFLYGDESDPGPYPIPPGVAIEGGPDADGDRQAIIVDRDSCTLYELFDLWPTWDAGSGAGEGLRLPGRGHLEAQTLTGTPSTAERRSAARARAWATASSRPRSGRDSPATARANSSSSSW